jgi:hypothetical protein
LEQELKRGDIPKILTGTPFRYIKLIEASSKNNKIKIYYGKENDQELVVKNEEIRSEIIDHLKEDKVNLPTYQKEHLSKFKASLKPLMVLMIVAGIVYYVADIAANIESGAEYEVTGGRAGGQGIGYLIIGLAQLLGLIGVLIIGAIPLLILLYKLVRNIQKPPIIESLDYRKK